MRMELDLLFAREPWRQALHLLQAWGGLALLEPALQQDPRLLRRLAQAQRLGLPLLTALVAGAADPVALADRLQLPLQHQRQLQQLVCTLSGGGLDDAGHFKLHLHKIVDTDHSCRFVSCRRPGFGWC